ncbi:MAG: hypothetical protein P1U65_07740 [Minwuia sp.]|nr:hypothetical protein [Minwuia sp.]
MTEFGHFARDVAGVRIDTWGAGPFIIIDAAGKVWRFQDSLRFGPLILTARWMPKEQQPGSRSAFWSPHDRWCQQGRKLAGDGMTCIWREPKPTTMRIHGRELVIVDGGEPDGRELIIDANGNTTGEIK